MTHGRFKLEKLVKYPHMKPADIVVWERFIEAHPDFFNTVDYDFHVGEGADFLPTGDSTPEERENRLYQRKIDVVGYIGELVYIIEVKPIADVEALGQVITYRKLFKETLGVSSNLQALIVAEKMANDMLNVFSENDVHVLIV